MQVSSIDGIKVQGVVDLSQCPVNQFLSYTSGAYDASGSSTFLAQNAKWQVVAGTINTGSLQGGAAAVFHAAHQLTVDGRVESDEIVLDGHPVIFQPISFVETAASQVSFAALDRAEIWQTQGTTIGADGQNFVLRDGEVLVMARKPCTIRHRLCSLSVALGTIALISSRNGILWIRVLHDTNRKSVCGTHEGRQIFSLDSGKEITVSASPELLSEDQSVARRCISTHERHNRTMTLAEFSLTSLASNSTLLPRILHSNGKKERIVKENILRTSACLSLVTARHGIYR